MKNAYTIWDIRAGEGSDPFYRVNDAVAKREVSILANDQESVPGRNPEDFELWFVGQWDPTEKQLYESTMLLVCRLSDLTRPHAAQAMPIEMMEKRPNGPETIQERQEF